LKLNAPQLGGIEKIDRLYIQSFLSRVALAVAGVCFGVCNWVDQRGAVSKLISHSGT